MYENYFFFMQPIFIFGGADFRISFKVNNEDDNGHLSEKEIASYLITSREKAELFIKRWMKINKATRKDALKRLKQLGIRLSKLPK